MSRGLGRAGLFAVLLLILAGPAGAERDAVIRAQLGLFHTIFQFRTLGVPCVDSDVGRRAIGLSAMESAATDAGFALKICYTPKSRAAAGREAAVTSLQRCLESLAGECDAVYLTAHPGLDRRRMKELLAPLLAANLPSFSHNGEEDVRFGVLMSLAAAETDPANADPADDVAAQSRVRNPEGQEPRGAPPALSGLLTFALNLRTATLIGWYPPIEILASADVVYLHIEEPVAPLPGSGGNAGAKPGPLPALRVSP